MSKQVLTQSRSLWLHLLLTPSISHNREWSNLYDMEISSQVHKLCLNASIAWKMGRSHRPPYPFQWWDLQLLTMISVLWAGLALQVSWFKGSQQWSLTQTLAHPQPCSGMEERIMRAKLTSKSDLWVEIMGQKRKKIILIIIMVIIMTEELDIQNCSPLADQCPACSWPVASSQLSPQFIYWAWPHMIWNISLVSWGHLCPLSSSCAPPAFQLKSPWLRVSITKTSVCYQHFSPTKSKTKHNTSYQGEN